MEEDGQVVEPVETLDNIFVERLWRTVKYEEVYPNDYSSLSVGRQRLNAYFPFYNTERFHQSLDYRTPADVFFGHNSTTA